MKGRKAVDYTMVIPMKSVNVYLLMLAIILVLAGCDRQSPVELIDDGTSGGNLEIQNAGSVPDGIYGTSDLDSTGLFPSLEPRITGSLLVEGSVFDSPLEHREGVLVRAILFDRSAPIIVNRDTVAFKTVNIGNLTINGYPLQRVVKRYRGLIDTVLGVHYAIVSPFTGGFTYNGNTTYRFDATGAGSIGAFAHTILSPPEMIIQTPTTGDSISASRHLSIRWQGGGSSVRVLISRILPTKRLKTVLQLLVKVNRGGVVIPTRMLQLLPQGGTPYQFTFTSDTSSVVGIPGYPYDVVVQARGSQSIVLNLIR